MKRKNNRKYIIAITLLILFFNSQNVLAIEEKQPKENKKTKFSLFKKKNKIEEIKLPEILEGKPKIPFNQLSTMTIDDCVEYAINHNPNLFVSNERIKAAKSGIGQARSNYAPRLTGRVNYNHNDTKATNMNTNQDSVGFNVGISEMITGDFVAYAYYMVEDSRYNESKEEYFLPSNVVISNINNTSYNGLAISIRPLYRDAIQGHLTIPSKY